MIDVLVILAGVVLAGLIAVYGPRYPIGRDDAYRAGGTLYVPREEER